MNYNYSLAKRNRIVEENLYRIDNAIRRNRVLIRAHIWTVIRRDDADVT